MPRMTAEQFAQQRQDAHNTGFLAGVASEKRRIDRDYLIEKNKLITRLVDSSAKALDANAQALTAVSHLINYLGFHE